MDFGYCIVFSFLRQPQDRIEPLRKLPRLTDVILPQSHLQYQYAFPFGLL